MGTSVVIRFWSMRQLNGKIFTKKEKYRLRRRNDSTGEELYDNS